MRASITCIQCGTVQPLSRGEKINRRASLGSRMVQLKEAIPEVEKQARKTPPKTLVAEREKVEQAKKNLPSLKEELKKVGQEFKRFRSEEEEEEEVPESCSL